MLTLTALAVGATLGLTLYRTCILRPQIRELERKIGLPEFQATVHQQTMQFAFGRLNRLSVRFQWVILGLGLLSLGLVFTFLR